MLGFFRAPQAHALSPNPGHPLKLTLASHLPGSARIRNWADVSWRMPIDLLISIDLIYPSSASYPSYPSLYLGHLPVFFIWSLIPCFADHHSTHLGWKSKTSLLSEPPTKNWLVAPGPRPWLDHDPHICGNLKGLHSLHHLKHRKYRN